MTSSQRTITTHWTITVRLRTLHPDTTRHRAHTFGVGCMDVSHTSTSSSVEIGAGSAAIELGADDTVPHNTESQVPILKISPKSPTPQEIEAHQVSDHVQYWSCRRHCVSARGIDHQRRSSVNDDATTPTIYCDDAYMSDNDSSDAIPMLVSRHRTTKAFVATDISKTGVDHYASQFIVWFMDPRVRFL